MSLPQLFAQLQSIASRNLKAEEAAQEVSRKFGQAVRSERKRRKITLKFFAAQLDYTTTMIAYLEKGTRQWPLKKAELAISILNRGEAWPDVRR